MRTFWRFFLGGSTGGRSLVALSAPDGALGPSSGRDGGIAMGFLLARSKRGLRYDDL